MKTKTKKKATKKAKKAPSKKKKVAKKKAVKKTVGGICKISPVSRMYGRGTQRGISAAARGLATFSKNEKSKRKAAGCLNGPSKKRKSTKGTSIVTKISQNAKKIRKVGEAWTTAIKRSTAELKRAGAI